jgi:hypothetical protein
MPGDRSPCSLRLEMGSRHYTNHYQRFVVIDGKAEEERLAYQTVSPHRFIVKYNGIRETHPESYFTIRAFHKTRLLKEPSC